MLSGDALIPEFIQEDATAPAIANEVISMLNDPERCAGLRERFAKLHDELALNANERAADALIRVAAKGRTEQ